jgi:hypothetical protein
MLSYNHTQSLPLIGNVLPDFVLINVPSISKQATLFINLKLADLYCNIDSFIIFHIDIN